MQGQQTVLRARLVIPDDNIGFESHVRHLTRGYVSAALWHSDAGDVVRMSDKESLLVADNVLDNYGVANRVYDMVLIRMYDQSTGDATLKVTRHDSLVWVGDTAMDLLGEGGMGAPQGDTTHTS